MLGSVPREDGGEVPTLQRASGAAPGPLQRKALPEHRPSGARAQVSESLSSTAVPLTDVTHCFLVWYFVFINSCILLQSAVAYE